MTKRARIAERIAALFDLRDIVFFAGLALVCWGGAMLSPPWTLIVVGAILVAKAHGPIVVRRSES